MASRALFPRYYHGRVGWRRSSRGRSNSGTERYRLFNLVERAAAPQQLARPVPGTEHRVTIASGGLQTNAVADCNFAATTADGAFPLQLLRNQVYRGPANTKGFGNCFLRH